jgi:Rod binding domain-containing protein
MAIPATDVATMPTMTNGVDLTAYANCRPPNDPRAIDKAASEFESVFLSLLMKEMRQTLSEGSMFNQDKGDVLGGLFDHYLGQHLAPAGALGIAAMVKKSWQMRGEHGHEQQAATPARPGH